MKKKISLDDLKIGMKFSAPLYTDDDHAVLESGVTIKESIYNRLVRWGIKDLYTDGDLIIEEIDEDINLDEDIENLIKESNNYIHIYKKCLADFDDFMEKITKEDTFDKESLEKIIKAINVLVDEYKNDVISYMAVESDDFEYLTTHAINTTIISIIGGKELKLDENQLRLLGIASLLHDLGMLKIPKEILNKKDKLTSSEYSIIKSHPISAYKQMSNSGLFNQDVLDAVLQHHEQFDGNGYPRKLNGSKINIFAKIISIADSFEAQIAQRVYRKSKTGYMAMKSVLAEAQNRFDPKVLRAFLLTLSIYPPGSLLQLNDNSIGTVISINPTAPLRPVIRIIVDEFGEKISENVTKDLKEESELFIVKVLNKDEYLKK